MANLPGLCVLVVDDNHYIREGLQRLLALEPAVGQVRTAASGEEALKVYADADVVLTDYRMPGISGGQLTRRLRELSYDGAIVVFSAHFENAAEAGVDADGADAVCPKGVDGSKLIELIVETARARRFRHVA